MNFGGSSRTQTVTAGSVCGGFCPDFELPEHRAESAATVVPQGLDCITHTTEMCEVNEATNQCPFHWSFCVLFSITQAE